MANVPILSEFDGIEEKRYDLYGRLLKDRIIFVAGPVDHDLAQSVVAQLLYLDAADSTKDIDLYVNSPGGSIAAGLAIYDTMQAIRSSVRTIGLGVAASMGALLLTAGSRGKRFALPHCDIIIHQPSGYYIGQATDIEIQAREMQKCKAEITRLFAFHSGQTIEKIGADLERDYPLSAQEAIEYGLIDAITMPQADKLTPKAAQE